MDQINIGPLPAPEPRMSVSDPTLADVMAIVAADPNITTSQRRDRLCAVRSLARILGEDPRRLPAVPSALALRYRTVVPAAHGITTARWGNIRSRTLAAIAQAGLPVMRGRSATELSSEWRQLELALPTPAARAGLSRFIRYCDERQIAPATVTDDVFLRFREALMTTSTNRSPHRVHRTAAVHWNRAAASVPSWPPITVSVPRHDRFYSYEWSAFPESFRADVELFLANCGSTNPFDDDYRRPLRAGTINLRRRQLRQAASLLVTGGVPISKIIGLATLVDPQHARIILKQLHARARENSVQVQGVALLLKVIAEHHVKASDVLVAKLRGFARNVAPRVRGMTQKNRERLRQFDDPRNIQRLLDLPRRVFRELGRGRPSSPEAAQRVMYALATELLLAAPMRLANLVGLDRGRHILTHGSRQQDVMRLVVPAGETKTGEPYELPIAPDTAALLETYIDRVRSCITTEPTRLLFPNHRGDRRSDAAFARGLTTFVRRETGLVMNPHLFRHVAVTLYLLHHPDDVETARRLLGHRSVTTTMRFYAGVKAELYYLRYDAFLRELRGASVAPSRGARLGGAGRR